MASTAASPFDALRAKHYNSVVVGRRDCNPDLVILRVQPDQPVGDFEPGQYTVLGLGKWEPRVEGVSHDIEPGEESTKLIRRAYSVSCPVLDDAGQLARVASLPYLEFYVALVRGSREKPSALTPRLFMLNVGDRLHMGGKLTGHYTLEGVGPDDDVLLAGTGTGEAPHNAMAAELLSRGHRGRVVVATCVRMKRDLGYLEVHRELERRYTNYRYLTLTTREPENLDKTRSDFVGKLYLQDFVRSPRYAEVFGRPLSKERMHVFLCGNPQMIGLPAKGPTGRLFPQPTGMVEILEQAGLALDEPSRRGQIHFEKYW